MGRPGGRIESHNIWEWRTSRRLDPVGSPPEFNRRWLSCSGDFPAVWRAGRAARSWSRAEGRPAVQAGPISRRGAGAVALHALSAKPSRGAAAVRSGAGHAASAAAAPAATVTDPEPRAPRSRQTTPRVRPVPAGSLPQARALPSALDRRARRVRLLCALPGLRGRELWGTGGRTLWSRPGVCKSRHGDGARGHGTLRVRAARHGLRLRRPLLLQHLRATSARPARTPCAPWPPAQGTRWPLRVR